MFKFCHFCRFLAQGGVAPAAGSPEVGTKCCEGMSRKSAKCERPGFWQQDARLAAKNAPEKIAHQSLTHAMFSGKIF